MVLIRQTVLMDMLIVEAACAGKGSVADYLVLHHQFIRLHLSQVRSPSNADEDKIATAKNINPETLSFASPKHLLEFVTRQWDRLWVTTDIRDEKVLDLFQRRPFFILISVEAPMSVRWRRQVDR